MDTKFAHTVVGFAIASALAAGFYIASADERYTVPVSVAVGEIEAEVGSTQVETENMLQRVLFTGDVMLARGVEWAMNDYGSNYPYAHIAEMFLEHDEVVVNFEASIPKTHTPTPAFKFAFSVDPTHLAALSDAGVTHASLANNHSFDFRKVGYSNTISVLEENGIIAFGKPYSLATSSVTVIEGDTDIALIGVDLTQSSYTRNDLSGLFAHAEANSGLQVVVVHWGTEYDMHHSASQEKYAKLFVELGADLVVGHHPHVVQDIERVNGVPVFYSLGNLIFDQYFSDEVQEGLMLSWDVTDSNLELIPVTSIGSRNQPRVMPEQEKKIFLEELRERSSSEMRDEILSNVISI